MNKLINGLMIATAAVLTGCCSCECWRCTEKEPNISVFASFIRKTAKERNISLAEAADAEDDSVTYIPPPEEK